MTVLRAGSGEQVVTTVLRAGSGEPMAAATASGGSGEMCVRDFMTSSSELSAGSPAGRAVGAGTRLEHILTGCTSAATAGAGRLLASALSWSRGQVHRRVRC
jgi:hypothetical protein